MSVPIETWWLARPSRSKYRGSFPLNFEEKLYRSLGDPREVLHQFGGRAEYGTRVDLNPETEPDVIGDAHELPFEDNSFDLVVCDPPYSDEEARDLYGTPPVRQGQWMREAVRVSRRYVATYHVRMLPRPSGTELVRVIVILLRTGHSARVCQVYRKINANGESAEQMSLDQAA